MSLHVIALPVSASISLCTGVLGLFMALPLLALRRKRASNFWLGMFVLSLALLCIADFNQDSGLNRQFHYFYGLFDWPVAALGAFYYCYVRSMLGLGNSWRQAWLFAPLAAWLGILLDLFVRGSPAFALGPVVLLFQLFACACAVAVLYRLHQYRRALRQQFSSTKGRDFVWLGWVTFMMLALLAAWLPATLAKGMWQWPLLLGRLAVLVTLGWYGMVQAAVFIASTAPAAHGPRPEPLAQAEPPSMPEAGPPAASPKYARSGMTEAAQQLIGERLDRRIAGARDYLDSEIKLGDLAERIGTSPQLLSQYLNDVLGINFFDYINGLRVAEVQKMMADQAMAERPLLDLAFGAGFNSRSTFNAAFKKKTGQAPSQWRKQVASMSGPFG